jgi:hypothetical protein
MAAALWRGVVLRQVAQGGLAQKQVRLVGDARQGRAGSGIGRIREDPI